MTKTWRTVLALALLAAAFALRAPFLSREIWNLDEGSTFTMAVQVRHGEVMYCDAADNRTPLVPYLKAAIFAVAGDWNATAVHVAVALGLGACALALWRLGRRLGDEAAGLAAAGLFLLLANGLIGVHESQAAHTEWFLLFFSTPAFLLFARWHERPTGLRGLAIGALFGLAALCKQPGLLDLGVTLVIASLLAWARPAQRAAYLRFLGAELLGTALVFAAAFAYFAAHGALADYVQYAWWYNTALYVPEVPTLQRWALGAMTFRLAWQFSPPLLVLACGGALALLAAAFGGLKRKPAPHVAVFPWLILGWSASGLASTMLSGRDFSHYAICAMPGLALAAGWAAVRFAAFARGAAPWFRRVAVATAALAVVWVAINVGRQAAAVHRTNEVDPGDLRTVARFTGPDDRLFVWGYVPEFHFFTHRRPATRFVYSVFLTGMIPWTNTDPLRDTRYAIVPGSWEKFWADFRRNPPPLVVDGANVRGFGKYPLVEQPELWGEIRRHYVRVRPTDQTGADYTFYLRAPAPDPAVANGPAPIAPAATPDPAAAFEVALAPDRPRTLELAVTAPADTRRAELIRDGRVVHRAELQRPGAAPATTPCRLAFLVPLDDSGGTFQVRLHRAAGLATSAARTLEADVTAALQRSGRGPALQFAGRDFAPLDAQAHLDVSRPRDGGGWLAHAPSFLEYARPAALAALALEFGLEDAAWRDRTHRPTTGVDVFVDFAPTGGAWRSVFTRRLNPLGVGGDQGPQRATVALPPGEAGRVRLRFGPGPMADAAFDWSWWGPIRGQATGPLLAFGDDYLPAREQSAGGGAMRFLGGTRWLAHTPAWAVFDHPGGLHRVRFAYGLDDAAWDGSAGGKTDGLVARVALELPDGKLETVFERRLDPARVATDRGPQRADVLLPRKPFRALRIALEPGPYDSAGFDWSYLEGFEALGAGPAIALGGGRSLAPESSDVNREGPMNDDTADARIGAHAPSWVSYVRPLELAVLDFGFGLFEGAYFDDQGRPRSDGIEVFVELVRPDGTVRDLFRRELAPATRSEDRGLQRARVILPRGEPGRLRVRVGPGPSGSNAFDWAYLTDFRGELAP